MTMTCYLTQKVQETPVENALETPVENPVETTEASEEDMRFSNTNSKCTLMQPLIPMHHRFPGQGMYVQCIYISRYVM